MSILNVLLENLRLGPLTLRFPERLPPVEALRGPVQIDAARCVGCATCAYVCASSAICVTDVSGHVAYRWEYDPGRCTFCARCSDYCPGQALALASEPAPVYHGREALKRVVELPYPACPRCGKPAPTVSPWVLERAFAEISPAVQAWSRLCPHCRQETIQPAYLK